MVHTCTCVLGRLGARASVCACTAAHSRPTPDRYHPNANTRQVLIFAILSTWTENYGNTSVQWQATMTDAIQCIRNGTPGAARHESPTHLSPPLCKHAHARPDTPLSLALPSSPLHLSDRRISSLGLVQSLFEASMYTFVFMWTPTIQDAYEATFSVTQSDVREVLYMTYTTVRSPFLAEC